MVRAGRGSAGIRASCSRCARFRCWRERRAAAANGWRPRRGGRLRCTGISCGRCPRCRARNNGSSPSARRPPAGSAAVAEREPVRIGQLREFRIVVKALQNHRTDVRIEERLHLCAHTGKIIRPRRGFVVAPVRVFETDPACAVDIRVPGRKAAENAARAANIRTPRREPPGLPTTLPA